MDQELPSRPSETARCLMCAYSLDGLAPGKPCPECGCVIDLDLLMSDRLIDAASAVRALCIVGSIGWAMTAFGYWTHTWVNVMVMQQYYPSPNHPMELAFVWVSSTALLTPIALNMVWMKRARRMIYRLTLRKARRKPRVPKRVLVLNLPVVLTGLLGLSVAISYLAQLD